MNDNVDDIKKELDEVRKLKEELRREVEDIRREKEDTIRRREKAHRRTEESIHSRRSKPPRPSSRVPPVPPVPPVADIDFDLSGITDSLEDMMDGLGRSIEASIKGVAGIGKSFRIPGIHIHRTDKRGKKVRKRSKKMRKSNIEKIPPERVAKIVAPLGSEERLRILEFLKGGGKTFNDIEIFTEKTGSSLTHHLNPLVEAGYVVKGEVRGTYYLTVEGRLAYRLSQWLTHRVEKQRTKTGNNGSNGEAEVTVDFEEDSEDDAAIIIVEDEESLEKAAEHLDRVAEEIEEAQEQIEEAAEEIEEAKEAHLEELEEIEDEIDDDDDIDVIDWKD